MLLKIIYFFLFLSSTLQAASPLRSKIPLRIWQTYKTKDLPAPAREARSNWIEHNPEFTHSLLEDIEIRSYIEEY